MNQHIKRNKVLLSLLCSSLAIGGCANTGKMYESEFSRNVETSVAPTSKVTEQQPEQRTIENVQESVPEKRFDLILRNAPIHQVYLSLVDGTGWSMILPKSMQGEVTISLKKTTIADVLETLRETHGYEYRVEGRRIIIENPGESRAKVFKVYHPVQHRTGKSDTRILSGSVSDGGGTSGTPGSSTQPAQTSSQGGGSRVVESSRVQTEVKENFWEEIVATLRAVMSPGNDKSVTASPQAGIVVVRGDPTDIRNAEKIIKSTQDNVAKQVLIESKIIDVQLNDGNRSGINWANFDKNGNMRWGMNANMGSINATAGINSAGAIVNINGTPTVVPTTYSAGSMVSGSSLSSIVPAIASKSGVGGALGLAFRTGSFISMMEFLQTQGRVRVLSSPRIAAINNQKALLKIGTDEYFVTNITNNQTTTSTGTTNSPTITTQPFFSGIALDITPQVDDDSNVTLHIHPSVSSVSTVEKQINLGSSGSYTLPLASSNVSETDSVVRIQDGQVAAIGGLFSVSQSDTVNKVPGAGDIPVGGLLFKDETGKGGKRELVVLVKATIIKNKSDWEAQLDLVRERLADFDRHEKPVEIDGDSKQLQKSGKKSK